MRARLTYQDVEDRTITVELTGEATATIGRSRDNTVVLRDEHASRMHARIQFDRGQWLVRDFGLNGTRLNGVRVEKESALRHGDEVRVGDTRMKFALIEPGQSGPITKRHVLPPPPDDPPPSTRLQHDDLSVLCNFMAAAMREQDTHRLLRQSLDLVLHQTGACIVGFLSDDPNDPVTKMVAPETATVDAQLSRQLIKRVQRDNKAVWLFSEVSIADTRTPESIAHFADALCLPLRAAAGPSMGTLHVYRLEGVFTDRDLRFCETIAIYLANALRMHRAQTTLRAENSRLRGRADATEDMIGDSAPIRELRDVIARVAPRAATVLVRGESGAGKELVALAMHKQSDRASGPLVIVNCAAIPANLMEAELFGYRKGAFSGADRDHQGYFLQADEGTIFLDEIAELSSDCQAKLLRVLDARPFRQVGGTEEIRVNVRIVAATNQDIEAEIKAGRFREDLYFRLKVVALDVPPLREHADDIPFLVQYFLDKFSAEHHRQYCITDAAVERLQRQPWPGNVRQLRTVLESAACMAKSEMLDVIDLRLDAEIGDDNDLPIELDRLEEWAIRQALRRTNGVKLKAAQLLGISRDALYGRMLKYGLVDEAAAEE
jgi:Nif-specific regulatory protein